MKKVFFIFTLMLVSSFTFANTEFENSEGNYEQNGFVENCFCDTSIAYENNESDLVKSCRTFTVTLVLVVVEISTEVTVCCGCRGVMCQNPGCWTESSSNQQASLLDGFIDISDLMSKYGDEITELKIKESSKEKIFENDFSIKSGSYKVIKKDNKFYLNTKIIKK